MSKKLVTSAQVESIRQMANAKGVGRENFQRALDDGNFARLLDSLKEIEKRDQSYPYPGGVCIHTLHIRYNPNRKWQDAISAGGPDTLDYEYLRAFDSEQRPLTAGGIVEETLVLLNYPNGDGDWEKAHRLAGSLGLENIVESRELFAIGEHFPNLHHELGVNPMFLVATKARFTEEGCCTYFLWFEDGGEGTRRLVQTVPVMELDSGLEWFAFRKPKALAPLNVK